MVMATLEQVEKLRQYANISYDEAKQALDASNDDMLEAIILLERQGKIKPPQNGGFYSSRKEKKQEGQPGGEKYDYEQYKPEGESFSNLMKRFFKWCGKIIHKGNTNWFEISRKGERVGSIPITVLVLLLVFCFYFTVPLIIVGLFFGCNYRFRGKDFEGAGETVNKAMDSASEFAENIKKEVKNEFDKERDNRDNE